MATAAQVTSVVELAANVALAAIPYTAAFAPLAVAFEAGINPLIASFTSGATKTSDVLAGFGAMIALINTLKAVPGVPADVLAKLDVHLTAAQDGLTAALAVATKGFDATQLTQLQPIT
jgi:hypothetical protein